MAAFIGSLQSLIGQTRAQDIPNPSDLAVSLQGIPAQIRKNADLGAARIVVGNIGPGTALGSQTDKSGYVIDVELLFNSRSVSRNHIDKTLDLAPQRARGYPVAGRWLPPTLKAGGYQLCAEVNRPIAAVDPNTQNNRQCHSFVVVAQTDTVAPTAQAPADEFRRSDLTLELSGVPSTIDVGSSLSPAPRLVIRNLGTGPAEGYHIRFLLLHEQQIIKDQQAPIGRALQPGDESTLPVAENWLPRNLAPGNYDLCAQVDAANAIVEVNENNNADCERFAVVAAAPPDADNTQSSQPGPRPSGENLDLVVVLEGLPDTVEPGATLGRAATAVVSNLGRQTAPGNVAGRRGYVVDLIISRDRNTPRRFAPTRPRYDEDVLLQNGRLAATQDIAPGDQFAMRLEASRIHPDTPPGTYFICARVDPGNIIVETNEANNQACHGVVVVTRPDLNVRLEGLPKKVMAGGALGGGATAIVSNPGRGEAAGNRRGSNGYIVDLVLAPDKTVPNRRSVFEPKYQEYGLLRGGRINRTADLAAGSDARFDIGKSGLLADTPPGAYFVCARVDPGNAVAESDETNNLSCEPIAVVAPPDLIVSIDGLPPELSPGEPLGDKVRLKLQNTGGMTANGSRQNGYELDIILSTDGNAPEGRAKFAPAFADDGLVLGGRITGTPDLSAGEQAAIAVGKSAIREDTPPGKYFVCARVDPGNAVSEHDESNNSGCAQINIANPKPDLILAFDGIPAELQVGGVLGAGARAVVSNAGDGPAFLTENDEEHIGLDLALSTENDFAHAIAGTSVRDDIPIQIDWPGTRIFQPGETVFFDIAGYTVPKTTSPGTYHICGLIDAKDIILESDEEHNTACQQIIINPPTRPVDLVVSLAGLPEQISAGETLGAEAVVKAQNQGGGTAKGNHTGQRGYMIDVLISSDTRIPDGFAAKSVEFVEYGLLTAGRISNTPDLEENGRPHIFSISKATLPESIPAGRYNICVRIDPEGVVAEESVNDNLSCRPIEVLGNLPDLIVSFDGLPRRIEPGMSLGEGAKAVASNAGDGIASGTLSGEPGYMIDVMISSDDHVPYGSASFEPAYREDVMLRAGRASNTEDLDPGASAILDIENDTIPADTPVGSYLICALIDPFNAVPESYEDNNHACQRVEVVDSVAEPDMAETLRPAEQRGPMRLSLAKSLYGDGDRVRAELELGAAGADSVLEGVLLVSEGVGDVEHLVMRRSGGGSFSDSDESVIEVHIGDQAEKFDGRLHAKPGDRIVALFYPDPARHIGSSAQIIADIAVFETAGDSEQSAAVTVEPRLDEMDRNARQPGERPFGSLVIEGTRPIQVATQEVLFRPINDANLRSFLEFSGGEVKSFQPATVESAGDLPENRLYLIGINHGRANPDRLPDMRRLFGETRKMVVANDDVRKLYAFILEARMRGYAVSANQKVNFTEQPGSTESRSGALNSTALSPITPELNVQAIWAFSALWDLDEIRIPVGIVDMGFITDHPDMRRPERECDFDDGIAADALRRSGNCGDGRARGIPTVGNSLFGDRSWHGTGTVITAGGILNNEWRPGAASGDRGGAAGVAGQIMVPMLYRTGLGSYVYEMGAAMRQAVDHGAACVNVSAGYPCRIQSPILPDVDLCAPGGREGLCVALFGTISAAAATACASTGLFSVIPLVGPILSAAATESCGALTVAATVALPSCLSFFIISGDVRSAMRTAAEYAEFRGVPVIASAGNTINVDNLPVWIRDLVDTENKDAGAWGIIPATLPTVIGVGSVSPDSRLTNLHFTGPAVDIWAPEGSRFHAPADVDSVPSSTDGFRRERFTGTSAAAPFVTGVIATMQAANSRLRSRPADPTILDATTLSGTEIGRQVRAIISGTATESPDRSVPAVINPLAALQEAARRAGVPLLPGYDTALNLDETTPAAAMDSTSDARLISYDETVTGTIINMRGERPIVNRPDVDWYKVTLPTAPRFGTFTVRIRLRMPTASQWGRLELAGRRFTVESAEEINADETEITYVSDERAVGAEVFIGIKGVNGEDNVYQLDVETPEHMGIPDDPYTGTTPEFNNWVLVSETQASKTYQLIDDLPTLEAFDSRDNFRINGVPSDRSIPGCVTRLEIEHPGGVALDYADNRGTGPLTFDSARRERATLPTPPGQRAHPVSTLSFEERSMVPTEFNLAYSVAPGGVPQAYAVRLTWVTCHSADRR